jgi:hypothetical protein
MHIVAMPLGTKLTTPTPGARLPRAAASGGVSAIPSRSPACSLRVRTEGDGKNVGGNVPALLPSLPISEPRAGPEYDALMLPSLPAQSRAGSPAIERLRQPRAGPAMNPPGDVKPGAPLDCDIICPQWEVGCFARQTARLHLSIMAQMDGIIYSLLGVRLEADVFAPNAESSYCVRWGNPAFTAWSTFVGIFYPSFSRLDSLVAVAASQRCCGLFVVPVWPVDGNPIRVGSAKGCSWRQLLAKHCLLTFNIPKPALVNGVGKAAPPFGFGIQGVFCNFASCTKFKSKRRPEKVFCIANVGFPLDVGNGKLGVTPFCPSRVSPLAHLRVPKAADDKAVATPPFPAYMGRVPSAPSVWNEAFFAKAASYYPFSDVAALAVRAVNGTLADVWVGDPCKAVVGTNGVSLAGKEDEVRVRLHEEIEAGRVWGPLPAPPLPNRVCPCQPRSIRLMTAKKNKHDLACTKFRLISNASTGRPNSTNDLSYSPKFIGFHVRARHIRDVLAYHNNIWVFGADVPKCFRRQRNAVELLHLFVYSLYTAQNGLEFYVDLCNPFGWHPAEWGWQSILQVLKWTMMLIGLLNHLAYVDNFWSWSLPEAFQAMVAEFKALFAQFGLPLHELQEQGTAFSGLGWEFEKVDGEGWIMVCPPAKRDIVAMYIAELDDVTTKSLSLFALRRACGVFNWVTDGFVLGKPALAHLVHMRTAGEALAKRSPLVSAEAIMVPKTAAVVAACTFWNAVFSSWDGRRRCVLEFGPCCTWETMGKTDASTDWGCGGLFLQGSTLLGFSWCWTEEERASSFVSERSSTGVLELLGAQHWFTRFAERCAGTRLEFCSDHQEVVRSLESGYSPTPSMMPPIGVIRSLCVEWEIVLRTRHVVGSRFNVIADHLSHNRLQEASIQAGIELGLSLVLL